MAEANGYHAIAEITSYSPADLIEKMRNSEGIARELAAIALFGPTLSSIRRMINVCRLDGIAADEVESDAAWRLVNATQPGGGYVEQGSWRSFVASTVRHSLGDMWRVRGRKPAASLDELQEEHSDAHVPTAASAEEAALALAAEWRMFQAFTKAGIASRTAEICIRHLVHNQPYEEIVADLGGTEGAARIAVHRALKVMRRTYADNPAAIFHD